MKEYYGKSESFILIKYTVLLREMEIYCYCTHHPAGLSHLFACIVYALYMQSKMYSKVEVPYNNFSLRRGASESALFVNAKFYK